MTDTKLVVWTVVVEVPKDMQVGGWSVRAIETKQDFFTEIVESSCIEQDDEGTWWRK